MAELFEACAKLSLAAIVIIFLGLIGYAIAKKNNLTKEVTFMLLAIIILIVIIFFFAAFNNPSFKTISTRSNLFYLIWSGTEAVRYPDISQQSDCQFI